MTQKYPTDWKPRTSRLPKCCTQRNGLVKKRYDSEAEARKHVVGAQETYPCRQGGFHIRTKRN